MNDEKPPPDETATPASYGRSLRPLHLNGWCAYAHLRRRKTTLGHTPNLYATHDRKRTLFLPRTVWLLLSSRNLYAFTVSKSSPNTPRSRSNAFTVSTPDSGSLVRFGLQDTHAYWGGGGRPSDAFLKRLRCTVGEYPRLCIDW